ncbi:MAG: barstar family protein [Actinomycetota bacterium]|nr:barstar family protein [Actinomycetota bacterium]
MSGLAGLLAGHHQPGVYQWHAAFEPADVRHSVEHAGWRFAYVDGWTHQDKAELFAGVAEALGFPDSFGHNFDALADCLADVEDQTVLLWDGWGPLARTDRRAFDVAVDVFSARGDDPPAFAVLLRGEGPAGIDVRSLDG